MQKPLNSVKIKEKKSKDRDVNGQSSATNTTRLDWGGMLNVKRQSHVLRHVMALW